MCEETKLSDEVIETGINWDHDTGQIHIDTRRKSVESKLRKLGFKPVRSEATGYTSFRLTEDDIVVSFRKKKRLNEEERAHRAKRLARVRSSRKNVQNSVGAEG